MSQEGCAGCKRVREHVTAVFPFQVVEKIVDKPLRIRGVAMTAGMSRNFNIYTPEELQSFASKLLGAPVYIEHVSVESAVGKVTNSGWDGHALWYEAEIFESEVAEKIRKGLVRHVSVGADYEAIDLVAGKVPHGLHHAELSLVAVPGIPESNVQVVEKLASTDAVEASSIQNETGKADSKIPEQLEADAVEKDQSELKSLSAKLAETEGKLAEALKTVEEFKTLTSLVCLVKDKPKTLPIEEAVAILEGLLPCPAVERSSLGMMWECQAIRSAVFQLKERLVCCSLFVGRVGHGRTWLKSKKWRVISFG